MANYASASDLIDPLPLMTARSSKVRRQARTILVVDDEVAVQKLLRHFLEEKGYAVRMAGSVGEAISVLEDGELRGVPNTGRLERGIRQGRFASSQD
jgi:hypothetical protein